jgi:hypothetical protein
MEATISVTENILHSDGLAFNRGNEHYSYAYLADWQRKKLADFCKIQIDFPADFGGEKYREFIADFLKNQPAYLYYFSEAEKKSKLRSYHKIIAPKQIHPYLQPADYLQVEMDWADQSFFACLFRLNAQNMAFCLKTFSTNFISPLIVSQEPFIFSEAFVQHLAEAAIRKPDKGLWTFDYAALLVEYVSEKTFISQKIVDGQGRIFWRIFAHQSDKEGILKTLKEATNNFENQ